MSRIEIELPDEFVFSTEIPIRISDINRGRHLGHDAILPMMEEARVRFLRSLGFTENNIEGAAFILVDAGIIYKKQGYYGQTYKIEIAVSDFTSRGCDLLYRITDADTGDEMVRAKTGMLFYDYKRQKVVPVPDGFRKKLRTELNAETNQMNPMHYNHTISQVLKTFVIPEIEKRINAGSIKREVLPIELRQFRASQKKELDGSFTSITEINEEVTLIVEGKRRNQKLPGESITIQDIDPEECFLKPPEYNGKPAGYFYWRAMFLNFIFMFDLTHNVPEPFTLVLPNKSPFPIVEIVNADNFIKKVQPLEKFRLLAANHWPPSPGYYPQIFNEIQENPELINEISFVETVSGVYNPDYWKNKLNFWAKTNFFPGRITYIEKAIEAHYRDDFITSIYIIVPQFEGIITDYLEHNSNKSFDNFSKKLEALKELFLSRTVILFPREVLDVILEFIDIKAFWKHSSKVKNQKSEINRHGIAHGIFTGFECKEISLKLLILLDALAYVLLNDRIVSENL